MPPAALRLLSFGTALFTLVGIAVAAAGPAGPFTAWRLAAAEALLQRPDLPPALLPFAHASLGILGGSIAGKWIAAWFLVRHPLAQGRRWARHALVAGLLAWFAVDVAVSAAHGAWFNVWMIDLLPLALVGIPLCLVRADTAEGETPDPTSAWRILRRLCGVYAAFGFALPLLVASPLFAPYVRLVGDAYFAGAVPADARVWLTFVYGIVGATFGAHFLMLWWALRAAPGRAWVHRMVGTSVGTWFVVDSASCLWHGAAFNVLVVNLPCLVTLAVPWALARGRGAGPDAGCAGAQADAAPGRGGGPPIGHTSSD